MLTTPPALTAGLDVNAGDIVALGTYEQNGDNSNTEPILWKALHREGRFVLLISQEVLEYRPYHDNAIAVSWMDSSLRDWLNKEFYDTAFNADETRMIRKQNDDHVRLLSVDQMKEYLTSEAERVATPTEFASSIQNPLKNGRCWWWLLNEKEGVLAPSIDGLGGYHASVDAVTKKSNGVRPCVIVELDD